MRQGETQSSAVLCVPVLVEASAERVRDHWVLTGMFPWHPGFLVKVCKGKKKIHFFKQLTLKRKGACVCPVSLHFYFFLSRLHPEGADKIALSGCMICSLENAQKARCRAP